MRSDAALEFPPFRLDLLNQQLWRGAELLLLRPKPFAVLAYLAARAGRLVPRAELVKAVWPDTHVGAAVLRGYIRDLRLMLDDDPEAPRYIETLAHRGYRFIAAVSGGQYSPANDQPSEPAAGAELLNPTLVGRDAELGQLHRWLTKAMQGSRQVVFVTGEPGIGKTTVVDAFLAQAAGGGKLRIARGQCVEHFGAGEVYLPVLEALGQLCRQSGGEEVIALVGRHAPTWLIQMPALIGDKELEAVQRRVQGATRERMLRELAEALEVLTAGIPLALVIEDLQWSDFSTLDLISLLAQRRGRARLLLLGTYRPADVIISRHPMRAMKQELQVRGQCEELALGCLTAAEVNQYLASGFPTQHSPAVLGRLIHQTTDGNPLFMVNVLDYWVSQRVLVETDGQWRLVTGVADARVRLPESLRQMIEKQLERLTPQERRVVEAGSVAGREFSTAAVAAAVQEEPALVEESCEGLSGREQFLRAHGTETLADGTMTGRYGFIHALYQQVLYEQIAEARRVRLHRQLGQWLEASYAGRKDEIAGELAVHFERGGTYEQAVYHLGQAAENAGRRHAPREAVALLSKGLELLMNLPDTAERRQQELVLRIALGVPLLMTKGYAAPDVERTYARARELCQQLGESPQLLPALAGLFKFYFVRAEFQTARQLGGQVLRLANRTSDHFVLAAAHSMLGVSVLSLGEIEAARNHLEQGIALYDFKQHRYLSVLYGDDPGVVCLSFAAVALWFLGYPDQALQRSQEALALAQELSVPYSLAFALSLAAWIHVRRREAAAALKHLEALKTLATEQGFAFFLAEGTILQGWALAEQLSAKEGISQMRQALAAYQATGAEMGRPSHLALLAEACGKIGQTKEGLDVVENALAAVNKTGERTYEAELYRLKGELLLQSSARSRTPGTRKSAKSGVRGNKFKAEKGSESGVPALEPEAEAHFLKAIEVARQQQTKSLELRALMSLSRLRKQGKQGEARRMLAEIYGWFTEGLETADLKDAKALLDELNH